MVSGRSLRLWHRRLGLTAAAFVFVLCVTGLMLNHSGLLNLDEARIETALILDWYGIDGVDETSRSFQAGETTVSWAGGWVFLEDTPLAGGTSALIGAAVVGDLIVLSTPRELLIATNSGELVERFFPVAFSADLEAIGALDDRLFVKSANVLFASDPNASVWTAINAPEGNIAWSVASSVPAQFIPAINRHLRGEGLPVYRIVLDLHSGRFFGEIGVWVMDAAAILLLVLSLTGVWIWWPRR